MLLCQWVSFITMTVSLNTVVALCWTYYSSICRITFKMWQWLQVAKIRDMVKFDALTRHTFWKGGKPYQLKIETLLRGPYTYESGLRVRLSSGPNEPNSSMCGSQSWESVHSFVVKLIRARLLSQARRAVLASQTCTCMGPFRNVLKKKASHFMNLHSLFNGKCLILHVAHNSRFSDNFTIPRVTLQWSQYFYIAMFNLKSSVFWNIPLCSPVKFSWCFKGTYHLDFHAGSLLALLYNPEDVGSVCFQNVSWLGYIVLYLRR
jgi:hypothetical protein